MRCSYLNKRKAKNVRYYLAFFNVAIIYSYLKAVIGSSFAARLAGNVPAKKVIIQMMPIISKLLVQLN